MDSSFTVVLLQVSPAFAYWVFLELFLAVREDLRTGDVHRQQLYILCLFVIVVINCVALRGLCWKELKL